MPITVNEMLLRGCTLQNSKEVVGLVVYAGRETRIQKNSAKTPLKIGSLGGVLQLVGTLFLSFSGCVGAVFLDDACADAKTHVCTGSFDRFLNIQIAAIIGMQLALCAGCTAAAQVPQRGTLCVCKTACH